MIPLTKVKSAETNHMSEITIKPGFWKRVQTNSLLRFFMDLRLTHLLSPVTLVCIIAATALPQVFLWYSGVFVECEGRAFCSQPFMGQFSFTIPITISGIIALVLTAMATRIMAWIVFEISGQWASQGIHAQMTSSLSHVRVSYFDQNPSGKLLNRLIGDYENLKLMGVIRIGDSLNAIAEVIFIAALVFLSSPVSALLVVPVLVLFFYLQRQISLMLGHTRALSSGAFGSVLHREIDLVEGSQIYKLYGKESSLLKNLRVCYSKYLSTELLNTQIWAWSRFWIGLITIFYSTVILVFVARSLFYHSISEALAAVLLTAVFRLSPAFSWLFWSTSYLSESGANAKRVFEVIDLPSEVETERAPATNSLPPIVGELSRAQSGQLQFCGDVCFENFSMSYRPDTPLILNGLNLRLREGKKIGIIGRTGSGKSSLVQSLFRMVYLQKGDITWGGNSIFTADIFELRRQLALVPQSPTLFEGTVRSNLDRGKQHTDDELIAALHKVGLFLSLGEKIMEGGNNFSLGERQLLCLARILVSDKKMIFLDEPTSAVDPETDARIQRILHTHLASRTVVTIAHRLETLALYDEIVELAEGKVIFQGSPQELASMRL